MVKNWWRNKTITCRSPSSFLKNPKLTCKTNTGHINKVGHPPESCDLGLSNEPKNAKNGPVWVKKINY